MVIIIVLIVILNPVGDAIRDKGNKGLQKTLEGLRDVCILFLAYLLGVPLEEILLIGLVIFFLRMALHNPAYNLVRGVPWWFAGTTSATDRWESRFNNLSALIFRVCALVMGIVIYIIFKGL